jgi:HPt (histidine-containing phosphotransfer) domain-containing protein
MLKMVEANGWRDRDENVFDLARLANELVTSPVSEARILGLGEVVVRSSCHVYGERQSWAGRLLEILGAFRVRSGSGGIRLELGRDTMAPMQIRLRLARIGSEFERDPSGHSSFVCSFPAAMPWLEPGLARRSALSRVSLVVGERSLAGEAAISDLPARFGYAMREVDPRQIDGLDGGQQSKGEVGLIDTRLPLEELTGGRQWEELGRLPSIPFFALGRRQSKWSIREAILLGARGWIDEPITSEALHALLLSESEEGTRPRHRGVQERIRLLDEGLLRSQGLGSASLLGKLVDAFQSVTGPDVESLLRAIAPDTQNEAMFRASRIAGSAASIGAWTTRELMGAVEQALKAGDFEGAAAFSLVSGRAFERDLDALQRLVAELDRRERSAKESRTLEQNETGASTG